MNQVFSFKRYVWLLKRQWYENAAIYKWGIVLMVLVVPLLFWMNSDWETIDKFMEKYPYKYEFYANDSQYDISHFYPRLSHIQVLFLTGMFFLYIYGGWFFNNLTSKQKRMFNFSLPATTLERVALVFTCVMILMPILLLIVFNVFDFLSVQLFNHIHGTSEQMFLINPKPLFDRGEYSLYGGIALILVSLLGYLSNTSILMLGSLMLGKKGQAISVVFMIVFLSICYRLYIIFFDVINSEDIVRDSVDFIGFYFISPSVAIYLSKSNIFIYILPLAVCWAIMFFVMKKKEA